MNLGGGSSSVRLPLLLRSKYIFNIFFCLHGTFHNKRAKSDLCHPETPGQRWYSVGETVVCRGGRQLSELRISPGSVVTTYLFSVQSIFVTAASASKAVLRIGLIGHAPVP